MEYLDALLFFAIAGFAYYVRSRHLIRGAIYDQFGRPLFFKDKYPRAFKIVIALELVFVLLFATLGLLMLFPQMAFS
jgi:hypothetical protein